MNGHIIKLQLKQFHKCSNIWDMECQKAMALSFYEELQSGNRLTFVYVENDEFLGEGSLVFENGDPDYTVPNRRIYLSRMIVKEGHQNRGIGGYILDYLITYATRLGYAEISLGVDLDNVNARHLYTKKGFTTIVFQGADKYGEYIKLVKTLENKIG